MNTKKTLLALFLVALSVTPGRSHAAKPCSSPPAPPAGVTVTGSCAGVTVTWNASTGATSYNVIRGATCGTAATTFTGVTSPYSDTTGTPGTTYQYWVVAVNACGTSGNSACAAGTKGVTPGAPTGVTATASADDQITLSWSPVSGAATYSVYRVAGSCPGTFGAALATGIPGTTYVDNTATAGNTYAYVVTAVSATGCEGAVSSCVSATARGTYSSGRYVSGRPQDTTSATQAARWIFNTSASTLSAPSAWQGVYTGSNDRMLHGMQWGTAAGAGTWPGSWVPFAMNAPAQDRFGVIPTSLIAGHSRLLYVGSQDGHVYCVDADSGAQVWMSPLLGDYVQAAPTGTFTAFGGAWDLLFVGTRNSTSGNTFYALNAATGAVAWSFDDGGGAGAIGIISSAAQVDAANKKVYFTSRQYSGGSTATVWCLSYTNTSGVPCTGWSAVNAGDVDAAPTLSSGNLYIGNNAGQVIKYSGTSGGTPVWTYSTADGPVKGSVWTDWSSTPMNVYFSTTTKLWSVTDNGASAALTSGSWPVTSVAGPSMPLLFKPAATPYLVVGSSDGRLYEINAATMGIKSLVLGSGAAGAGNSSVDFVNSMYYVGTTGGDIYAATAPLP